MPPYRPTSPASNLPGSEPGNRVSEVTRRNIVDELRLSKVDWAGRLDEVKFLSRIFDLSALPSRDNRHKTMEGDVGRHRVWWGEVAGSSDLERSQGIARSTLHAWQKQDLVIGLLKSARHHVFPLAQFIDGRPIQGLDAVLAAIGDPRTAWLWLVTEHPELGGKKPIDRLRAGAIGVVSDLAGRDYGQS